MESTTEETPQELETPNVELTDEQIEQLLNRQSEPLVLHPEAKGLEAQVFNIGIVSIGIEPLELMNKKIKVTVRLCGLPAGSFVLTEGAASQTIGPNVGIAKASVTLTVNWGEQTLTFACKACVRNWLGKWKCKSNEGELASW